MTHIPVLLKEVIQRLDPKPNQNFIDCTLGDGGHAFTILEHISPNGRLLGIDTDPAAVAEIKNQSPIQSGTKVKSFDRLILVNGNFRDLAAIVKERKFGPARGVLLDLGFSSSTLERGRGFSFEKDELLDMRFNPREGIRAAEIVNGWNQKQLRELLEEYGEEPCAREIADRIVEERKRQSIITTKQLTEIICMAYREKLNSKKDVPWIGGLHPATRTFQALRIAVNDELNALQEVLPQAVDVLAPSGRLAVIAFHSLEDRIVKNFFREAARGKMRLLVKKPVCATQEEIAINSKSRGARLRVAERYA